MRAFASLGTYGFGWQRQTDLMIRLMEVAVPGAVQK